MSANTIGTRALTAGAAHLAVEAAVAHGRRIERPVCCAVVDAGGNLLAFLREPGAPLHCVEIAIDKAYTAASFRCSTPALYAAIEQPPALRDGILARPRLVAFAGGLPLTVDGAHVGGLGVSGASEEEDVACAEAGVATLRS